MKTKIYTPTILLIVVILTITSCRSVNKLYQNGDYDQAVYTAVKKINKNKLKPETKELIASAYAQAIIQHEQTIANILQSGDLYKWENALQKFNQAQQLSNAIYNSKEAMQFVVPKNYQNEINNAIENAVNVRIQRGQYFMDENNKQAAQQAYYEFDVALQLRPYDKTIIEFRNNAFNNAVTNIFVDPIQARRYSNYYEVRNLENTLLCNLQNNNSNIFLKFYNNNGVKNNVRIDKVMHIYYDGLEKDRIYQNTTEKNVFKENVLIKEIRVRPDSIVKEYGTVYAKFVETKTTQNFTGKVFLQIIDKNTNQIEVNRSVDANYCFNNQYASFTGDERALTNDQKNIISNSRNNRNINEEEINRSVTEELIRKINAQVRYL